MERNATKMVQSKAKDKVFTWCKVVIPQYEECFRDTFMNTVTEPL